MDSLFRLLPYLITHQWRLGLSIGCALVSAVLWATSLGLTFPIVKILLQGNSFHSYVNLELERATQEISRLDLSLRQSEQDLKKLREDVGHDAPQYLNSLRSRARVQERILSATRRVAWFSRLKTTILPFLPEDVFTSLAAIFGLMLVLVSLHGLFSFFQESMAGITVELALEKIRQRLFRSILRLDFGTLTAHGKGTIESRFQNDIPLMREGLATFCTKIVLEPLKVSTCLIAAFATNWRLTLLAMICAPLGGWALQRFGRRMKRTSHQQMDAMARLYGVVNETLQGFRVVSAFGNFKWHRETFIQENNAYLKRSLSLRSREAIGAPLTEFIAVCAVFLALLPGAYLVLREKTSLWGIQLASEPMDAAHLSMLYGLLAGIMDPVRKLSGVYSRLRRSSAACERVFSLIDEATAVHHQRSRTPLERHHESLEFDRVSFAYAPMSSSPLPLALDDVSLKIRHGEVVAFVGPNGSGKSTLVDLVPRLRDPQRGEVRIDGKNLTELDIRSLRRQIGVVSQEAILFDRTISENIAYGLKNIRREQIEAAARAAHVMSFAERLPEGLETKVGPKGHRLSGGQRQRISLARALLRNPSILILDEPTSAIDAQSEQLIYESLKSVMANCTTLIVTHSLPAQLLEMVSRIVVMNDGRVVATGSHEEMMATCPLYRGLFESGKARMAA